MAFWKTPFRSLLTRSDLVEFCVLDCELLGPKEKNVRVVLYEGVLSRESDHLC